MQRVIENIKEKNRGNQKRSQYGVQIKNEFNAKENIII